MKRFPHKWGGSHPLYPTQPRGPFFHCSCWLPVSWKCASASLQKPMESKQWKSYWRFKKKVLLNQTNPKIYSKNVVFNPKTLSAFTRKKNMEKTCTLPETNIFAPANGWLEDDHFLLELPIFSGVLVISGSVKLDSLLGCPRKLGSKVSSWVIIPIYPTYK